VRQISLNYANLVRYSTIFAHRFKCLADKMQKLEDPTKPKKKRKKNDNQLNYDAKENYRDILISKSCNLQWVLCSLLMENAPLSKLLLM
jgi:hypothetical protein